MRAGLDRDQSLGQVEGAVYWADKVDSLSTEAEHRKNVHSDRATTAMRNNLHKSQAVRCPEMYFLSNFNFYIAKTPS